MSSRMRPSNGSLAKLWGGYACIALMGMGIALAVNLKFAKDYEEALQNYRAMSQREAETAATHVTDALKLMYQGIRTISQLPSVKSIDRYGKNLNADAHAAIEHIYHNMMSNVAVSEIYIVPVDLEPEKIDAHTGSLQTPILMYDGSEAKPEAEPEPLVTTVEQAMKAEEVEIYEYRLLKEQMAYLRAHYPTHSNVKEGGLPMIAGASVLTCDNADYEKTKQDEDRTGAVFSVPFYGADGVLKGAITAVIRNNVLRDQLPAADVALLNETYGYRIDAKQGGQMEHSAAALAASQADAGLLFSTVVPVPAYDPQGEWKLWVGYPDSKFFARGDVQAAYDFKHVGYGFAAVMTLLASLVWSLVQRAEARRQQQVALSEQEKRRAMAAMADGFELSVKDVVAHVASSALQMQSGAEDMTRIAADTKQRSETVVAASDDVSHISSQVAVSAEELTTSIQEISKQTQLSSSIAREAANKAEHAKRVIDELLEKSDRVSAIVQVVNGIAAKINLLALNATIESARAGEAGKGFAVVASEVKGLANQVASATAEIRQKIDEMQDVTNSSVHSIGDILEIIGRVSFTTSAVASAVEEQSAATDEIARNISRASEGTKAISDNIGQVQEGAGRTGDTSQQVLASARTLSQQSTILKEKVEQFLRSVRG